MKTFFLFDGKTAEGKEVSFPQLKRGFLYGDGVFETMRASGCRIFRWEKHWKRLRKGLDTCNLKLEASGEKLRKEIERLLGENGIESAYVRLNAWRKETEGFDPSGEEGSHLLVMAKKYAPYGKIFYEKGISCTVSKNFFKNESSPLTFIKSFNYLESILARTEAKREGFDETIMLNNKGHIAESSASNLFFVKSGIIYAPSVPCGILPGITREMILEICKSKNIGVKEGCFKPDMLREADEIFLTNTLMGVLPVRKVEGFFEKKKGFFSDFLGREAERIFSEETAVKP